MSDGCPDQNPRTQQSAQQRARPVLGQGRRGNQLAKANLDDAEHCDADEVSAKTAEANAKDSLYVVNIDFKTDKGDQDLA